jgi:hypothetical protein
MSDVVQQIDESAAAAKPKNANRPPSIGKLAILDVDKALTDCEKTIKLHSETVRAKLSINAAIPGTILRELSRANAIKSRLVMRRIALLVEAGDQAALDLIDKLIKLKPAKVA